MWVHRYEAQTKLLPAQLWPVIANVNGWAAIDDNIDHIAMEGEARAGSEFSLKPRGGPLLRFRIGVFEPPHHYSDVCKLFLAEMETTHRFVSHGEGTTIEVRIEIRGPLAWLWGRMVGSRHAAGLPAQTEKFVAAALKSQS